MLWSPGLCDQIVLEMMYPQLCSSTFGAHDTALMDGIRCSRKGFAQLTLFDAVSAQCMLKALESGVNCFDSLSKALYVFTGGYTKRFSTRSIASF